MTYIHMKHVCQHRINNKKRKQSSYRCFLYPLGEDVLWISVKLSLDNSVSRLRCRVWNSGSSRRIFRGVGEEDPGTQSFRREKYGACSLIPTVLLPPVSLHALVNSHLYGLSIVTVRSERYQPERGSARNGARRRFFRAPSWMLARDVSETLILFSCKAVTIQRHMSQKSIKDDRGS